MSTLVLEHIKTTELPGEWAKRLKAMPTDMFRIVTATEVDEGVSLQDIADRASRRPHPSEAADSSNFPISVALSSARREVESFNRKKLTNILVSAIYLLSLAIIH